MSSNGGKAATGKIGNKATAGATGTKSTLPGAHRTSSSSASTVGTTASNVNEKSHLKQSAKKASEGKKDVGGVIRSKTFSKGGGATSKKNGKVGAKSAATTPPEASGESTLVNMTNAENSVGSPGSDDMRQLVHMDFEEKKSTLPQVSFNFINSIIGSGVIGMPYALHQSGVGLGIILMIFVALMTDYSLVLMVRAGELSGSYTYAGMMEAAFGRPGFYLLSFTQFVYPIIAMISYNIIVGDTLTKVLIYFSAATSIEFERQAVVLLATFCVTLPLSLYRDVARMAKISFLSLVSIGFILLSILVRLGPYQARVPVTADAWQFSSSGILNAIGVFSFAFMCHHNTFMLYKSMENTDESKWSKVTHVSVGTSLFVSIIFAIGGYATFTGHVQGDLLENYCWDDDLINVSRVLFCFTILLTFPLECFVARDVIETIFFSTKQPSTRTRHFCITFLIVIAAFAVSMVTDCLGVVLELNGILAAMPLAYILPALCFIRLEPSRLFSREKIPALATALFGLTVSISGLIMLLIRDENDGSCSHGRPMAYCTPPPNLNQTLAAAASTSALVGPAVEFLPHPVV